MWQMKSQSDEIQDSLQVIECLLHALSQSVKSIQLFIIALIAGNLGVEEP